MKAPQSQLHLPLVICPDAAKAGSTESDVGKITVEIYRQLAKIIIGLALAQAEAYITLPSRSRTTHIAGLDAKEIITNWLSAETVIRVFQTFIVFSNDCTSLRIEASA